MDKKSVTYISKGGKLVPEGTEELIIPDEAISYVISNYLQKKSMEGNSPIVVGISTHVVQDVLSIFVSWAGKNGYIKDGILIIGGHKIG